jgi:hypothetical protein
MKWFYNVPSIHLLGCRLANLEFILLYRNALGLAKPVLARYSTAHSCVTYATTLNRCIFIPLFRISLVPCSAQHYKTMDRSAVI